MQLKTQTSSKPRLKKDTLGDEALLRLYESYAKLDLANFKVFCEDIVQSGGGGQPTKDQIILSIKYAKSKDAVLTSTNNFIMAGMGCGV